MRDRQSTRWIRGALGLTMAVALAGCSVESSTEPPDRSENTAEARSQVFANGDFETGTPGQVPPAPWNVTTNMNPGAGIILQTPQTKAGLNLGPGGASLTTIINAAGGAESLVQPDLGAAASLRLPKFGNQCAVVNFHGDGRNSNTLSQAMTVGAGDVDPADGNIHVRFVLAPVLENPLHDPEDQPYFFVQLTNITKGNLVLYQDFNFSAQPGVPWKSVGNVFYTDWQLVDIAPGPGGISPGDQVLLEVIGTGCSLGGHWGQVYVDGVGTTVPGLIVSGTGPQGALANTDITYNLTYKNGSATGASGVVVEFNTPPNTTFVSINAPGLTCTTPAPGAGGLVSCTVGALGAGAFGDFDVTVHIDPAATGQIVAGNYNIDSTTTTPLLGSKITTVLAECLVDGNCAAAEWCHPQSFTCTPDLSNGTQIPNLTGHNPALTGTCTAPAAAAVCLAGVCDAGDDLCAYANGTGPCTQADAGVVCRSAVCDPDGSCGYANGNGPCTLGNQGTVCRSGACSPAGGICVPAGGCGSDEDCESTDWCNTQTFTCVPKLPNGQPVPTVANHTPPLTGVCSEPVASAVCESAVCDVGDDLCGYANGNGPCDASDGEVVCRSQVCDPDGNCGYANGNGPCTVAEQDIVCRSATCSPNGGICIPPGGCGVDADCASTEWCNTESFTCTPKLPNGQQVPTVANHAPPLVGVCSEPVAVAVCVAGVCDVADDQCGYANGTGPCTMATGGTVCRSGVCSLDGTCMPLGGCNVDGDCAGGSWCAIALHQCLPQVPNGGVMPVDPPHTNPTLAGECTGDGALLVCVSSVCDTSDDKCGYANGNGACDGANADVVCRSAVCDPDGKCGYDNGNGPCTLDDAGVVCRSSACSANGGVCVPPGGCAVDADCGPSEWCHTPTFTCTPKLPNGTDIPTVPGHTPELAGACTPGAGDSVCASGVCDSDNKCGYATGTGPCTELDGGVVCRSGECGGGVCVDPDPCQTDSDCDTTTQYCDTGVNLCAPKLPNGTPMPVVPGHQPTLDGVCSAAESQVVCLSAVCDAGDNQCGYANGTGPCTPEDAGIVCRSSTCSPNGGVCIPSGGCGVDADCAADQWCNTESFSCAPKLPNGVGIPTVGGHTPDLSGECTPGAGTSVCESGVCDAGDNQCGYTNGTGPCTMMNGGIVCRSGYCDAASGVCAPPVACNIDADCDLALQYCDTGVHFCAPKLPNGSPLPAVFGHQPPLDGTCNDLSGAIVCLSGVCDEEDHRCGHANGQGPCDAGNGSVVCRSEHCATMGPNDGLCVECAVDDHCQGSQPVCDPGSNHCVQCLPGNDDACQGSTPVCVTPQDTCGPCDGDFGSGTPHACGDAADPYCFVAGPSQGQCGKCMTNDDCTGHPSGPLCDPGSGACGTSCDSDSDCAPTQWCNAPVGGSGMCVPKLDNGTKLPGSPPEVTTCTPDVGARVCISGVCDPTDDTCGYLNGNGPCDDGAVCQSGACDIDDNICGILPGNGPCDSDAVCRTTPCDLATQICAELPSGCTTDADCADGEYCAEGGVCTPRGDEVKPAGNGLLCAAQPGSAGGDRLAFALLGLLGLGLARRRRR